MATQYLPVLGNTVAIYFFLVVMVRFFGRRQLGQLTPIDFVVVILLGSCVETSMIHGDTGLRAGLLSATALLIVNRLFGLLFAKSRRLRHLMVAGPVLVVHNGRFVAANLHKLGLTEADVLEALRAREQSDLSKIRFGVMEADGEINVVPI